MREELPITRQCREARERLLAEYPAFARIIQIEKNNEAVQITQGGFGGFFQLLDGATRPNRFKWHWASTFIRARINRMALERMGADQDRINKANEHFIQEAAHWRRKHLAEMQRVKAA